MSEYELKLIDAVVNAEMVQSKYADIIRDGIPLLNDYKRQIDYLERRILEVEGKNQRLQESNRIMRDTIKSYGGKVVVPDSERPWYKRIFGHSVK